MTDFTEGDIVRLKSGGPHMTINELSQMDGDLPRCCCEWFDGSGKQCNRAHHPDALVKVDWTTGEPSKAECDEVISRYGEGKL